MKRILNILVAIAGCCILSFGENFSEKDLDVFSIVDGIKMGATLTQPEGSIKAAIVLATGSGTQNRDEELFGKNPFKTIAEFLSERGYAVLRVDDRGLDNPKEKEGADLFTYNRDVESAIEILDSIFLDLPKGIIGHSAGGTYAIMNAAHNHKTNFIVTLAAPAWSGDSIVMSQTRALAVLATGKWEQEDLQRRILEIAKSDLPELTRRMLLTAEISKPLGDIVKLPEVQKQLSLQVDVLLSPWYQSFLKYDPSKDIKSIQKPFLALNGLKDCQVVPANLESISQMNPNVDTKCFENLNHLFQNCVTGSVEEYQTLPEDINPQVLEYIADWLDSTIARRFSPSY